MSEFAYDKNEILSRTNGGLTVIEYLYPSEKLFSGGNSSGKPVHFKVGFLDEKTESAIIDKTTLGSDTVKVHIFKTGERFNCFDLVMQERNLEFGDACKWIAESLNLNLPGFTAKRGDFKFKDATEEQQAGETYIEYKDKLSEYELSILGPFISEKEIKLFKVRSAKSITNIVQYENHPKHGNAKKQLVTIATENYPIIVYDYGSWQKIYQPFGEYTTKDKEGNLKEIDNRFTYAGNKPENFTFGLDSLHEYYYSEWKNEHATKDEPEPKFKNVIIAAGDRDGLNISSLGFPVVWQNSETVHLEHKTLNKLLEVAENVCYCGDLDNVGIGQTEKLALFHIDIKIIWLPEWLKQQGKKDMTDYVKALAAKKGSSRKKVANEFNSLVFTALPARFWDEEKNSDGKIIKYHFNNEACHKFFRYKGVYLFKDEYSKDDVCFIQKTNNKLRKLANYEVKRIPIEYLRENYKPITLLNTMHRTAQISIQKLTEGGLSHLKPEFKKAGKNHQLFFFRNIVWKVTRSGIQSLRYEDLKTQVWEEDIIDHHAQALHQKSFKITRLGKEDYHIEILDKNNSFLNYLISTSRVHWKELGLFPYEEKLQLLEKREDLTAIQKEAEREKILKHYRQYRKYQKFNITESGISTEELESFSKEFRDGLTEKQIEGLSEEQINEQENCLVNKIFTYGYLHHTYKSKDRGWIPYAMEHTVTDSKASNGGTGKSLFFNQAMRAVYASKRNFKSVDGKNKQLIENGFAYTGVTPETNYIVFDDIDEYMDIKLIYNPATNDLTVNNKNGSIFTIGYEESPKMAITSNFGMYHDDGSTQRRFLFVTFSDYYHAKTDNFFEEYKVSDDFNGQQLFDDFDYEMHNKTYNFIAECVQFYLGSVEKINTPMMNVHKRNALQVMGNDFLDWANSYFIDEEKPKVNVKLIKENVHRDFKKDNESDKKLYNWSQKKLFLAIEKWCKFYGYTFNPKSEQNSDGYIRAKNEDNKTKHAIYIKTKGAASNPKVSGSTSNQKHDFKDVDI